MVRVWALLSAFVLFGCGRETRPVVVGVIPGASNNEFWRRVHAGAVKASMEFGLSVDWAASKQVTAEGQLAKFEELLKRKVAGVVVAPVDARKIAPAAERASAAGIPLVVLGDAGEIAGATVRVRTDNREAGRVAARFMGELMLGEGPVVAITCGGREGAIRAEAFRDELARAYSSVAVLPVVELRACATNTADSAGEFLSKHPQLRGVLAADEPSSDGVVAALNARANTRVRVVVFDASEARIQDLKDRAIDAAVVERPFQMGYEAVRAIGRKRAGQMVAARIDSGAKLVTRLNLETPEVVEVLRPDVQRWLRNADDR